MARLFTKLYLMLAALLLLILAISYFEERWLEEALPPRPTSAYTAMSMVEYNLLQKPTAQWADEVARLRAVAPAFKGLVSLEQVQANPAFPEHHESRLLDGKVIGWESPDYGVTMVKRLGQSQQAMMIELHDSIPRLIIMWGNMALIELIVVAIAMWFWVRPLWRDLRKLDVATASLARAEFHVRVVLGKGSVLHGLAQSFNWMAEHIGALLNSHRALTNAVSHELRTPLARMRFALSLAAEEGTVEGKDRQLQRMRRDLDELDALSSELLTLAKLERTVERSMSDDAIPAQEWLDDRLEEARATAQAFAHQVSFHGHCPLPVLHGNPQYLARALDNLLNNAARHAASQVAVTISQHDGQPCITVEDDGPGIADEAREQVFEPFVRLDASRDRASGGVGLGLAIVRQIARAHGGTISVDRSPLGGARFTLVLARRD
ncbi:ATP-binding protein [Chitinimonas sp.]|uniref:ATP-binding protein n=1 Tax=Chitinimonas sp. TaxID=1934313 RepID=UPI0035B1C0EB